MMTNLIFYFFLFGLITSSLMVILVKNPIHSILFLILVFFNSSGILILLNFEFLALIFIIIYVGAIAVLFLFVIMMLNIRIIESNEIFFKYLPLTLIICFIFCLEIFLLIGFNNVLISSFKILNVTEDLLTKNIYLNNAYESSNKWSLLLNSLDNLKAVSFVLFIYKFYLFILSGFILLLAMIGAIVLVFIKTRLTKKQIIYKQFLRNQTLKSFV